MPALFTSCIQLSCIAYRCFHDVGFIDVLSPILWFDVFKGYRSGLFSAVHDIYYALYDFFSRPNLLLFGFSEPEFPDDVRIIDSFGS